MRGLAKELTVAEMKQHGWGCFIFVKVAGVYRWANWMTTEHKQLVNDDEKPEAAGTVNLQDGYWKMADRGSMTLKLFGCPEYVEREITAILGVPMKEDD